MRIAKVLQILASYRPEFSGYRTFVKDQNPSREDYNTREPDSVLPSPPWTRTFPVNHLQFNATPTTETSPDGKSFAIDHCRTLGVPGEDYEVYDMRPSTTVKPRPGLYTAGKAAERYLKAYFFMDRECVDKSEGNYYNKASEPLTTEMFNNKIPSYSVERVEPFDNPGSARAIPDNHDFVNHENWRTAAKLKDVENACDAPIHNRSRGASVRLVKVDKKNMIWFFSVRSAGGKQDYTVKVKVQFPRKGLKDPALADVYVECNCKYWRYYGPDHWALTKSYLYDRPKGTAAIPRIRDPHREHGACKHVLAVINKMKTFKLGSVSDDLLSALKFGTVWFDEGL